MNEPQNLKEHKISKETQFKNVPQISKSNPNWERTSNFKSTPNFEANPYYERTLNFKITPNFKTNTNYERNRNSKR
jgi:hypothetical protein